jgi:thioester reductase-like protein
MLKSLSDRSLKLTPSSLQKVFALSADLSKPDFGLGSSKLEELRSKLTLVIHSAWAVNFNLPVQAFEDQHISAIHSFLTLCQSTTHGAPARFYFCSSVSSVGGTPRPGVVTEKQVADITHVQGTGYARSKYVAENIVYNASKACGSEARVLRIGQLSGDTMSGEWNITEGVPMMIQTAVTLGCLPSLDEEMSWLPVDTAASIILDLSLTHTSTSLAEDPELVYHVLNPKRFHWTRDMLPALASAGLEFRTVPTAEWMEKLRNSDRDPRRNPPIKLLGWFESKYGDKASYAPKGILEFETEETGKASETLGSVPGVTDHAYVGKVVERLRERWASG